MPRQTTGGPSRAAVEPGCRPFPQVLHRMVKVQDACGIVREALVKEAPQSSAAITPPDHLGRLRDTLPQGFEPPTRLACLDVPQDGYQPAMAELDDVPPWPGVLAAQTGQHAHFDLAPPRLAHRLACHRPKGHHHAISTHGQGEGCEVGLQRFWVGPCPLATPSHGASSCSMARLPATCTQHHTARALTAAPQYQLNSVAAVANGTKTANAQPTYWSAPLVR